MGNGNTLTAEGFVKNLQVRVQGHSLQPLVYLLPITGADLVLEATWLAALGPHIADYNALLTKFYLGDSFVTLHGEPNLISPSPAQFHHIKRLHGTHSIVELFTLQINNVAVPAEAAPQLPDNVVPKQIILLTNFMDVFVTPNGMPPKLFQDHAISSLEGSNHIKDKPYCYPPLSKNSN